MSTPKATARSKSRAAASLRGITKITVSSAPLHSQRGCSTWSLGGTRLSRTRSSASIHNRKSAPRSAHAFLHLAQLIYPQDYRFQWRGVNNFVPIGWHPKEKPLPKRDLHINQPQVKTCNLPATYASTPPADAVMTTAPVLSYVSFPVARNKGVKNPPTKTPA